MSYVQINESFMEELALKKVKQERRKRLKWFVYKFLMITFGAILMGGWAGTFPCKQPNFRWWSRWYFDYYFATNAAATRGFNFCT